MTENVGAVTVTCEACGRVLDEPPNVEIPAPCPACGCNERHVYVTATDSATVRERTRLKAKRPGESRPFLEHVQGDDLHRDSRTWMHLARTVDRENDRYSERIVDPATGTVVHECDEPLSEHWGHGSAKRRAPEGAPEAGNGNRP